MFKIKLNKISINNPPPGRELLSNCVLNFESGKAYILLGTNGCGKSTFSFAITGLLNKNIYSVDGSVLYGNIDLLSADKGTLDDIRKNAVKYVFQDPVSAFDPLKRIEYYFNNVNPDMEELEKLLNYFLLPPYEKVKRYFPHEVSVGMAQKFALILAFLAHPKLIIMDEPNSSLDLISSNLLAGKIKEFTYSGSTVLLITQDIQFAQNCGTDLYTIKNNTIIPYTPDDYREKKNKRSE